MRHYTLIFIFDESYTNVILIQKKSNKFGHKNLWNGLGGKLEDGETLSYGVFREFYEESNLKYKDANLFAVLSFNDMKVHVFRGIADFPLDYKYETDEGIVKTWNVEDVNFIDTVVNVEWLIEMARDLDTSRKYVEVVYDQ